MALIKCPECKKKVSDQSENCPKCGYPIKNSITNEKLAVQSNEDTDGIIKPKKPFYKKMWVWIVTGAILVSIVVGTILLLNHDTKPKFDKEGNPVFVELTNEVYTNANEYKGYHVNIKGQVFQVMSGDSNVKGIQIWLDPDTREQNLMIYYNTDVELQEDDYIICSGYIHSVTEYKNAYGTKMFAPMVISSDLKKATYIDVMSPTIATITPENLKQEKYGYSVSIDKIEFAKKETRVYATVTNNGKSILTFNDAVIVQSGKQYNTETNYDADYDEIPYEIVKGVTSSGIIVFPAINTEDFELTIYIDSDDYEEELDTFTFNISKENIVVEKNENTTPTTNSTTTKEDSKNRNQEAVSQAINVAKSFFPTDRYYLECILTNPSWEEDFDAFTIFEAEYAIENANIDWGKHAAATLSTYSNNYGSWQTPNDLVRYYLENHYTFTESEIQFAINNCGVNWNSIALDQAKNYIEEYRVKGQHITSYDIIDKLTLGGFSDDNIMYAIDNTDGYDKGIAEDPDERAIRLSGYGYTREEIIQDFISGGWSRDEAEELVNKCGI